MERFHNTALECFITFKQGILSHFFIFRCKDCDLLDQAAAEITSQRPKSKIVTNAEAHFVKLVKPDRSGAR